MYKRPTLKIR